MSDNPFGMPQVRGFPRCPGSGHRFPSYNTNKQYPCPHCGREFWLMPNGWIPRHQDRRLP